MAVIVEDGTGVAGANSYVTRADFIAYGLTLGYTIQDNSGTDVELVKAAEYISEHEANMIGVRSARDQALPWPRYGVMINGWAWASNEIPDVVKECQMHFAIDVHNGYDLWNRAANPNLIASKKKVDVLEVEYAVDGSIAQEAIFTSMGDSMLRMFLNPGGMKMVRV